MGKSSREEIVGAIRKCAEKLGRAPSIAEFRRMSKVSWHQVYRNFRGMRKAVLAAGLDPGPKGGPLDERALVLDWARVVRELGRLPTRAEYTAHGKHHSVTLHARIGWHEIAHRFVLLVREFGLQGEWGDVLETVCKKFPLLRGERDRAIGRSDHHPSRPTPGRPGTPDHRTIGGPVYRSIGSSDHRVIGNGKLQLLSPSHGNQGMRLGRVVGAALAIEILLATQRSRIGSSDHRVIGPSAACRHGSGDPNIEWFDQGTASSPETASAMLGGSSAIASRVFDGPMIRSTDGPILYGEPLGLAAMAHAPTNEAGVLFLFGVLAAELGFRVERIQKEFPDCEAKREVVPGKWERVRIEFEYESRNFKEHRHDATGCEVIVCWKHNWPDAPEGLEVVELRKYIG